MRRAKAMALVFFVMFGLTVALLGPALLKRHSDLFPLSGKPNQVAYTYEQWPTQENLQAAWSYRGGSFEKLEKELSVWVARRPGLSTFGQDNTVGRRRMRSRIWMWAGAQGPRSEVLTLSMYPDGRLEVQRVAAPSPVRFASAWIGNGGSLKRETFK